MPPGLILKSAAAGFCHKLRILELLASRKLADRGFVLAYHRVLAQGRPPVWVEPGMYVSAATFARQAECLKKRFSVLPLSELLARAECGKSVGGCCALTFDDGWLDNYTQAYPILRRHDLPATIFLATGFIGTSRPFWPEEVVHYLQHADGREVARRLPALRKIPGTISEGALNRLLPAAIAAIKRLSPGERAAFLDGLRAVGDKPPSERLLMNWQEAAEMRDGGLITFGAHTVNHVMLDQVSLPEATTEISRSRQDLERNLQVSADFFSYPNGNASDELEPVLRTQGFSGAVTVRRGWVGRRMSRFRIPRIGMHEDVSQTLPLFLARILWERF